MLLFHLSDLHIGKTFHGYELLEDQAYMLDSILEKIGHMNPAVLLIAGDIYDRAIPPVSAIELFDKFIRSVRRVSPSLKIVIVPGNHDSAGRLAFGSSLLADSGLFIVAKLTSQPLVLRDNSGNGAAIWALPFLTQGSASWDALAMEASAPESGGGGGGGAPRPPPPPPNPGGRPRGFLRPPECK